MEEQKSSVPRCCDKILLASAAASCCKQQASQPNMQVDDPIGFIPFTDWLVPSERKKIGALATAFTDQDGKTGTMKELMSLPTALTFFYTRCNNQYKCSLAASTMAQLQHKAKALGMEDKMNLVLISYEPHVDTPDRLKTYGTTRGIDFNNHVMMLRLIPEEQKDFVNALDVPVSYNAGWVNMHEIVLYLLDHQGRLARKYHTVIWDNDKVLEDLKELVAEIRGNAYEKN